MTDKKHSVQWFKPNKNYRDEDDPIGMGFITVEDDGSLTVTPEDDHYWGRIAAPEARLLTNAILAPLTAPLGSANDLDVRLARQMLSRGIENVDELSLSELVLAHCAKAMVDDPRDDATDAAHPAWLRGNDHGCYMTCKALQDVATGDFTGKPGFVLEEMNALAYDILGLRGTVRTLSDILADLRCSSVLPREKPEFLMDEIWEDLVGILERSKNGSGAF